MYTYLAIWFTISKRRWLCLGVYLHGLPGSETASAAAREAVYLGGLSSEQPLVIFLPYFFTF
jgi:hypothetical protein